MPAAIRIDLCSTAEVAPGNALKVDKAGLVLAGFNPDGEFVRHETARVHHAARRRAGVAARGAHADEADAADRRRHKPYLPGNGITRCSN
jgi:hypothetical protein